MGLTHIDEKGAARMVDVGDKPTTRREALAQAEVHMRPETLSLILADKMPKGDVFATCRIAGIMAAKKTSEMIPLCHPVPITSVKVEIFPKMPDTVIIKATVGCTYETGVEMEALYAATVASLTLYDMCKAVDRGMEIQNVMLLEKSGGRSGTFRKEEERTVTPHFTDGMEISLIDKDAQKQIEKMRGKGLCFPKFRADLVTSDIDLDALSVGDPFYLGGYDLTVSRKKECYEACALYKSGEYCPLKHGSIFAFVHEKDM